MAGGAVLAAGGAETGRGGAEGIGDGLAGRVGATASGGAVGIVSGGVAPGDEAYDDAVGGVAARVAVGV